jgi:hypothetical protein
VKDLVWILGNVKRGELLRLGEDPPEIAGKCQETTCRHSFARRNTGFTTGEASHGEVEAERRRGRDHEPSVRRVLEFYKSELII